MPYVSTCPSKGATREASRGAVSNLVFTVRHICCTRCSPPVVSSSSATQVNLASVPDSRVPSCENRAVGYDVRAHMMLSASVQRLSFSTRQGVDVAASTDRACDFGHHVSRNEAVTYVINVRGPLEALD
jgi:hypothetical protein